MVEFRIDLGIGLVAAGGNVEVMDGDRTAAVHHGRGDVAGIVLAAEAAPVDCCERQARDDGDAVIALLAVDRDVPVAGLAERLLRKIGVEALGLLQAEDVRTVLSKEAAHQVDPQPNGVDVPGGDGERHGTWKTRT